MDAFQLRRRKLAGLKPPLVGKHFERLLLGNLRTHTKKTVALPQRNLLGSAQLFLFGISLHKFQNDYHGNQIVITLE